MYILIIVLYVQNMNQTDGVVIHWKELKIVIQALLLKNNKCIVTTDNPLGCCAEFLAQSGCLYTWLEIDYPDGTVLQTYSFNVNDWYFSAGDTFSVSMGYDNEGGNCINYGLTCTGEDNL